MTYKVTWGFKLPGGAERISKLSPLIQANVLRALEDGLRVAEATAQTKYLTGPSASIFEKKPLGQKLGVNKGLLRSRMYHLVKRGTSPGVFAEGILANNAVYARIQELGGVIQTPAIFPKNVGTLKFFWKKAGFWRFAKKTAAHPSVMSPRPFLAPAIMDNESYIYNLIQRSIDKAYEES